MNALGNFNRIRPTVLALAIGALCFTGTAAAAEQPRDSMIKARDQLLNAEVKNRQGETLGEIEELVLDGTGKVQYIVISHGGFLDIGDKVVAVPWNGAQVALDEDEHVVLDVTREQLAQAPSFDKDDWPDMSAGTWNEQVRTFTDSYAERYEGEGPDTTVAFEDLDKNGDGHVSEQEASAERPLSARFAQLDRNSDGSLSRWEFNAYEQPATMAGVEPSGTSPSEQARASLSPREQERRDAIARADGQQHNAGSADASKQSDGNSGKSAEDSAAKTQMSQSKQSSQQPDGKQSMAFDELDADADGKLSRDEAKASEPLEQQFSTVDRNNDGQIDQAEFSAFESGDANAAQKRDQEQAGSRDRTRAGEAAPR